MRRQQARISVNETLVQHWNPKLSGWALRPAFMEAALDRCVGVYMGWGGGGGCTVGDEQRMRSRLVLVQERVPRVSCLFSKPFKLRSWHSTVVVFVTGPGVDQRVCNFVAS
jgi:hypothetical protein